MWFMGGSEGDRTGIVQTGTLALAILGETTLNSRPLEPPEKRATETAGGVHTRCPGLLTSRPAGGSRSPGSTGPEGRPS